MFESYVLSTTSLFLLTTYAIGYLQDLIAGTEKDFSLLLDRLVSFGSGIVLMLGPGWW